MNNDYGVFTENAGGEIEWMVVEEPFELGSEEDAVDNLSFSEAITIAGYLTSQGSQSYAPGRPKRRPH